MTNNGNDGMIVPSSYNFTVTASNLNNNGNDGIEGSAVANCTVANSNLNNNLNDGFNTYGSDNIIISGNTFYSNGFGTFYTGFVGGIEALGSNYTVTNNLFDSNYNGLIWRVIPDSWLTTEGVYCNNVFSNNYHTIDLQTNLDNSYSNQKIYFYNNLVNDSSYVSHLTPDISVSPNTSPSTTVLNLNTTLQFGTRIYSLGSRIGGNFWAHPDGTGFSQTGTDANHDGFIDTPFDLFGDGVYLDYLPYSTNDAVTLGFINGTAQSIAAGQISQPLSVQLSDSYGTITAGLSLGLSSTNSTGRFYSDYQGTNQITSLTIPKGSSIGLFYFNDTRAGTPTITASSPGLTNATTQFTITHGAASSVTITPVNLGTVAGITQAFSAHAIDAYSNTWDATSATTWSISSGAGGSWSSNNYTSATAGTWTVTGTYASVPYTTTLTVNPGNLNHFAIIYPYPIIAGTPFTLNITAVDPYGNTVPTYTGTNTLTTSLGTITPTTTGAFTNGFWSGSVTLSTAGNAVIIYTSSGGTQGTSNEFTVQPPATATPTPTPTATPTPTPSPSPTPTSSSTTSNPTPTPTTKPSPTPSPTPASWISANVVNGTAVEIPVGGNITSTQYSNATLSTSVSGSTVTISFQVTGTAGTTGFGNMTIPKSTVPADATPAVYIDGTLAADQGYTQDAQNFYVWYYTHFSTHNVQVKFVGGAQPTKSPSTSLPTVDIVVVVVIVVAAVAVALIIARSRAKGRDA